jgi:hypothetical protein
MVVLQSYMKWYCLFAGWKWFNGLISSFKWRRLLTAYHWVRMSVIIFNRTRRAVYVFVTSRRVHETIVTVDKQQIWHFSVCVWGWGGGDAWAIACGCGCTGAYVCLRAWGLTNMTCSAPPYRDLRPLWLHHIFLHYHINGAIFGKTLLDIKCVFRFSLQLLFETFLILRRIQRDIVINVETSSCKVRVILVGL